MTETEKQKEPLIPDAGVQTKAYGGIRTLPMPDQAPKPDEPLIMRAAKIKGMLKDNHWEAVNLVEVEGRWIATAEARGVGVQIQVGRHIIQMTNDPERQRFLLGQISRKLRKKLSLALMRAGQRPLPAVPEADDETPTE